MDTFQKFPHFIDTDIRINRTAPFGYNVNYTQMLQRHAALMPKELVANRSVLDLGCCVGATGAWVLDAGASDYTGVELQAKFAEQSRENLTKSFSGHTWQIIETSIEKFLENNDKHYDIIYAGGIIYNSLYYQEFLQNITKIADVAVVIESKTPEFAKQHRLEDLDVEFCPVVEYVNDFGIVHETSSNLTIRSAHPNLGVVSMLLDDLGFEIDVKSFKLYAALRSPHRYGSIFYKKQDHIEKQTTENLYNSGSSKITSWNTIIPTDDWKFDKNVASDFVSHARNHIPDYDKIIDLSVTLCKTLLDDPLNARIIDVGCATGQTINKLYANGCCNLIGVDNSQAMLDQCNTDYAFYALNDSFPLEHGPYDVVICNWTLHFIENKIDYLKTIYQGLNPGGILILTDKTENSGIALKLYHDFKRSMGVSDSEIVAKAHSVKNIMFVDSPSWYFSSLESIGFTGTSILSSAPCFTTFIAFKH